MTVGPWKPIRLETYTTRIAELDVRTAVDEKLDSTIDIFFILTDDTPVTATVRVLRADGSLVIGNSGVHLKGKHHSGFGLSNGAYERWYPVGYGKQPLYAAEVVIMDQVRIFGCVVRDCVLI